MDIAVIVSETARDLLISPVHTTDKPPNSCEVSWLVQCETLRYSHPPQKACFEDRNDHFMHYWHSVVLSGRGPALPCHHRLSLGSESRAGQSARVAGIAEVAARLLLRLAMGAPGCGRARPSLEGLLAAVAHWQSIVLARAAGSLGRPSRLLASGCVSSCQWTLELVCRRISGAFGAASGPRATLARAGQVRAGLLLGRSLGP